MCDRARYSVIGAVRVCKLALGGLGANNAFDSPGAGSEPDDAALTPGKRALESCREAVAMLLVE